MKVFKIFLILIGIIVLALLIAYFSIIYAIDSSMKKSHKEFKEKVKREFYERPSNDTIYWVTPINHDTCYYKVSINNIGHGFNIDFCENSEYRKVFKKGNIMKKPENSNDVTFHTPSGDSTTVTVNIH